MTHFSPETLASHAEYLPSLEQNKCDSLTATKPSHTSNSDLLEVIVNLPEHSRIPEHIFREFEIDEIAAALIERQRISEQKKPNQLQESDSAITTKIYDTSQIILFFDHQNTAQIEEHGFLNIHSTGTSGGAVVPEQRRLAEDKIIGLMLGTGSGSNRLRPKSAFLNIVEDVSLDTKTTIVHYRYGNIGAVLKDDVKRRSLWTANDSLSVIHQIESRRINDLHPLNLTGTFYDRDLPAQTPDRLYYEALVFGDIDLSDVDYFLVYHRYWSSDRLEDYLKKLKPFGKPIFKLNWNMVHGRVVYSKGEQL